MIKLLPGKIYTQYEPHKLGHVEPAIQTGRLRPVEAKYVSTDGAESASLTVAIETSKGCRGSEDFFDEAHQTFVQSNLGICFYSHPPGNSTEWAAAEATDGGIRFASNLQSPPPDDLCFSLGRSGSLAGAEELRFADLSGSHSASVFR